MGSHISNFNDLASPAQAPSLPYRKAWRAAQMPRFNKPFSILGILVGLMLIQACGKPLPPQESCNFVRNSQLQRVSWAANTPVEMFLDSSVPAIYHDSIASAIQVWNDRAKAELGVDELIRLRTGSNPGADSPSRDGVSKIYFMNTWDSNKSTEQARTTVYWAGSTIYEADIRVNDLNFDFFLSEIDRSYNAVHIESLLIHELGHVLGLAHNDSRSSVMQVALANGSIRNDVNDADVSSLKCEY